jgi:LCP family protein required for cell wall assembly
MSGITKRIIAWLSLIVIVGSLFFGFVYFFLQPPGGRTNFLVLGIPGGGHPGKDLADTIMFVSVENQTGETLILSLPRDIWITPLRTKLNSVYHYEGLGGTKKIVGEILGQPINYGVLIDFDVFTEIIDVLGGVEIEVERTFDDYQYPIAGKENDECGGDPEFKCRYEHLHFEAGKQGMDGKRALKYIRSRYAEGEEGTDFARSQRQQRLLLAIKNKILSPRFFLNPQKAVQLIKVVGLNIKTDILPQNYGDLAKIALRFRAKNLKMEVLNEGYLITPPPSKIKYDNQWVLVPKGGDWREVQEYVSRLIIN